MHRWDEQVGALAQIGFTWLGRIDNLNRVLLGFLSGLIMAQCKCFMENLTLSITPLYI